MSPAAPLGQKVLWFLGAIKLRAYFSMVKIPQVLLVATWATASSKLNA